MSMHSRSDFSKALESLSKVEIFKKMQNASNKVKNIFHDEFISKESLNKKTQSKKEELSKDIDNIGKKILIAGSDLKNLQNELLISNDVKEKLEKKVTKFREVSEVLNDRKSATSLISQTKEELKNYQLNIIETLIGDWIGPVYLIIAFIVFFFLLGIVK